MVLATYACYLTGEWPYKRARAVLLVFGVCTPWPNARTHAGIVLPLTDWTQVFQLHSHNNLFTSDDEDEHPQLTLVASMLMLAGITVCVAACSE